MTYRPSNLPVGASSPIGDSPQFFPNSPLKSRSLEIQRQIEMNLLAIEMVEKATNPHIKVNVITVKFGSRILSQKCSDKFGITIAQVEGTHTPLCDRN